MKLNIKTNLIGYLIILIPILFFTYICFCNKKEQFSLFSIFSKEKEPSINDSNKQIKVDNNSKTDDIFSKQFISKKNGPLHNKNDQINHNLNEIKRPKGELEPAGTKLFGNIQCRLLSECNNNYKFTGAEFNNSVCPKNTNESRAKAVAKIKNGYIDEIFILDGGNGYIDPPKVRIEGGNGRDAYALAILDSNNKDKNKKGRVIKIDIKNVGRNYDSTPNIIIDEPKINKNCKLCCKIN